MPFGGLDTSTLAATLNGDPLTLTQQPNGLFTTTVDPGPPLLDENTLVVSAEQINNGQVKTKTQNFDYLPRKSRARQISDPDDCIEGPLAHCRVGDWLLENTAARFVIQDAPKRDLHSVGAFGGNVIDAELVVDGVRQGNDNLFEIQPSTNIEMVVNATSVDVVNDGQDGTAAIVRSCGPDDILEGAVDTLYTGVPTLTRTVGGGDFTVQTVNVHALPPGVDGDRLQTVYTETLPLTKDTWIVVVVRGTDGVSEPMFPEMPASLNTAGNTTLEDLLDGNLNESGVLAMGYTNALFVDVDGDDDSDGNLWEPPGVTIVP